MNPWKRFLYNLAELFKIKTIVTFAVVFVFCYQSIVGQEVSEGFFVLAVTAVINYYFTKGDSNTNSNNREVEVWEEKNNMP